MLLAICSCVVPSCAHGGRHKRHPFINYTWKSEFHKSIGRMKQEKQPKLINEKADARQATFCMKCHCAGHKCWRRSWSRATCGHILPSMRACTCQHSYCKSNLDRSICCPSRASSHRYNLLHRPSWSHCRRHSREMHLRASSKCIRWSTRLSLRHAVSQKHYVTVLEQNLQTPSCVTDTVQSWYF